MWRNSSPAASVDESAAHLGGRRRQLEMRRLGRWENFESPLHQLGSGRGIVDGLNSLKRQGRTIGIKLVLKGKNREVNQAPKEL